MRRCDDLPVILDVSFAVDEMQVGDDVRQGLRKRGHVAHQEVAPGVEAEARLAVHRVFGLDHLLNLEADAQRVLAEVEGEIVEVGAVEVALLPGAEPALKPVTPMMETAGTLP